MNPAMTSPGSSPNPFLSGQRLLLRVFALNLVLAAVKLLAGWWGSSSALVADGMESGSDLIITLAIWSGLRISARPPDQNHPYGHGKAESITALAAGLVILTAAGLIIWRSLADLQTPSRPPADWTLAVLLLIVVGKELLYHWMTRVGRRIHSTAILADAQHQRIDGLTSLAALAGVGLAVLGGDRWAAADDWAALAVTPLILYNAFRILRRALGEVMDEAAPESIERRIREIADLHPAVRAIEKCRIRKSGLGWWMDIHVQVDGDLTVHQGHDIGHQVQDALTRSELPIEDVVVHIEPYPRPPGGRTGSSDPIPPPPTT